MNTHGAIFTVPSHNSILFWLRRTSMSVKMYQFSFRVFFLFLCAFHPQTSSPFYSYFCFNVMDDRWSYLYTQIWMLERREECNTYLTHVCRHHCSGENPMMSTDVSQVGVTLIPSFEHLSSFHLPRFSFFINPSNWEPVYGHAPCHV